MAVASRLAGSGIKQDTAWNSDNSMAFVLRRKICSFEISTDRDVPGHMRKALAKIEPDFSKLMPD